MHRSILNKFNLRFKFTVVFSVMLIIMILVLSTLYYVMMRNYIFQVYNKKIQCVSQIAASEIDGDKILDYLYTKKYDKEFQKTNDALKQLKSQFDIQYIYVFKPENDCIRYIYNAYNPGDDENSNVPIYGSDLYMDGNSKIMHTRDTGKQIENIDISFNEALQFGYLASTYAPIFNSKGDVVALVGVDCWMEEILTKLKNEVIMGVGVMSFVMIILIVISMLFIDSHILYPLRYLIKKAEEIIEQCQKASLESYKIDLTTDNIDSLDEIKKLESVFARMTFDLRDYIINLGVVSSEKKRMEDLSNIDYLTGILNRRGIFKKINYFIEVEKKPFALAFFDLNNFKEINDNYGHDVGDQLLRMFTTTIKKKIEGTDHYFGRIGGDEFVLLYNNIEESIDIALFIDELRDAFKKIDFLETDYVNTFSVGTVTYPAEASSLEDILVIADKRMYSDKKRTKENK